MDVGVAAVGTVLLELSVPLITVTELPAVLLTYARFSTESTATPVGPAPASTAVAVGVAPPITVAWLLPVLAT